MLYILEVQLPPNTNNACLERLKAVLSISNEQMMREYQYTQKAKDSPVTSHRRQAIRRNHSFLPF